MREVLAACRVVAVLAAFACGGRASPPRSPVPPADTVTASVRDWRRGATCYEVFVRSFFDSDGDGIGDLRGLTEKLDYINDGNAGSRFSIDIRDSSSRFPTRATRRSCETTISPERSPRSVATSPARSSRPRCC